MTRVLRAGRPGYLPLGIIAGCLVAGYAAIWLRDGFETGAWQAILIIGGAYAVYAVCIRARVIEVSEDGIVCHYLIRKTKRVAWADVRQFAITNWTDGSPFQIWLFGESPAQPLLEIALPYYSKADREFLLEFVRKRVAA